MRSYFTTPIGYVFIAVFLAASGFSFALISKNNCRNSKRSQQQYTQNTKNTSRFSLLGNFRSIFLRLRIIGCVSTVRTKRRSIHNLFSAFRTELHYYHPKNILSKLDRPILSYFVLLVNIFKYFIL